MSSRNGVQRLHAWLREFRSTSTAAGALATA